MILEINCNSIALSNILYIVKNILMIIMIITPILAILSLTLLIYKLTKDPEDQKTPKKIINAIKAMAIIFFIPLLVNVTMSLVGNNTNFSACYNNAQKSSGNSNYIKPNEEEEKNPLIDSDTYEEGEPRQLSFNCKSSIIKAQFSCETLHIVAAHYRDFNYSNMSSVVGRYGGFDEYVKALGGFFEEYYKEEVEVTTVYEFQKISEYVFGFLYMYGADYFNGKSTTDSNKKYCKWGGSCLFYAKEEKARQEGKLAEFQYPTGSEDAFYPVQMRYDENGLSDRKNFDAMISNTSSPNITTNCNWAVDMVYYKAGIFGKGRSYTSSNYSAQVKDKNNKLVTEFKDLQVGDIIHFFETPVDSSNPSTWTGWRHVAYVGEVNKQKQTVTVYDGGSYFTSNRNHKWTIDTRTTTKKLSGYAGWGAVHIIDLK